ncbi:MAG: 4-hydroxy-3-methylbut-2-enyl diphosphate reductase [Planctomycetota bacterium]|jgi:4-hydroxy-3-methylbut-2-enyl diphosphate reductase
MQIKLAKTAGFCMGVRRAVEMAQDAAAAGGGETVYTHGPIIHNEQAVEALKNRGVEAIKSVNDTLPPSKIVIRAHGLPRAEMERLNGLGHTCLDATCPHVLRSQRRIEKASREGKTIILVGDRDHAEMVGLAGYVDGPVHIITSLDEAKAIEPKPPFCVIAQTTFSASEYEEIAEHFRSLSPDCTVFDSICRATSDRQNEVRELAAECDAMVVVGGRHSANTCRLAEIAGEGGKPVFHIETEQELNDDNFADFATVGITAGASTPGWLTQTVIDRLSALGSKGIRFRISQLLTIASKSYLYTAVSAVGLALALLQLFECEGLDWKPLALVFAYIYSIYTYNRHASPERRTGSPAAVCGFYRRYRMLLLGLAGIMTAASLALAWRIDLHLLLLLVLAYGAGAFYTVPILPGRFHYRRLKDLPASKDIFVATAWAVVLTGTAAFASGMPEPFTLAAAWSLIFLLVFAKTVALDLRDTEGDRLIGSETIPILIGTKRTIRLLYPLQGLALLVIGLATVGGAFPPYGALLAILPVYGLVYLKLFRKGLLTEEVRCQVLVDGQFLLAGIIALGILIAEAL